MYKEVYNVVLQEYVMNGMINEWKCEINFDDNYAKIVVEWCQITTAQHLPHA